MLAIRPPEYFPRLAYLALLDQADRFLLADTFQYSRQSFQNRARLRTPQGWQWISIPLHGGQHGRPIAEVELGNTEPWMRKHWRSFEYNYRSTPFFEFYEPNLAPLFDQPWTHLGALTCATVEKVAELYGLTTEITRASDLPDAPGTLAGLHAALDAPPLLVPEATAPIDAEEVDPAAVLHYEHPTYRQNFDGFEPDLSALDLLFNYGPDALRLLREGVHAETTA